ncbi:MAG: helix-turn-helix domain-containing protein [Clostridiales bacterium]|nr:helix-turn-helix domain-containing protein [Clostridiales bacterium]
MPFIEIDKSIREKDWSMREFHSHDHYEIYFLNKGSRFFFLSNALYKINGPAVVVIPPHTVHKTEGGSFERYNINVSSAYLDPFQKEILEQKSLQILKITAQEAKALSALLDHAYTIDKATKKGEYQLRVLFSYGIFLLDQSSASHQTPQAQSEMDIPPLILKVLDYLNAHYSENITLDGLAEKFFVSKPTLIYNFKKYTKRSPIDFLLTVRITKAKQLLVSTKQSVEIIADTCGFSSANYFGLIFKKKEGISPLTYRKNQLAKM